MVSFFLIAWVQAVGEIELVGESQNKPEGFATRNFKYLAIFGAVLMVYPLIVKWSGESEQGFQVEEGTTTVDIIEESDATSNAIGQWHDNEAINELITKHIGALGGLERLIEADSHILEGTITEKDGVQEFYSIRKRPNLEYLRISDGEIEIERWFDGTNAWKEIQKDGVAVQRGSANPEALTMLRAKVTYDDPIIRYVLSEAYGTNRDEIQVNLLESEAEWSHLAGYWMEMLFPDEVEYRIFLDSTSFLIRRQEFKMGPSRLFIEYDQYSEFSGMLYPTKYEVSYDESKPPAIYSVIAYREAKGVLSFVFRPDFLGLEVTEEAQ